jgi:glutaminase
LEDRGLEYVVERVGVEPSGEAFNSISLEPETGRPRNPMINAGAIATTGMIEEQHGTSAFARLLKTFSGYTGRPHELDEKVYLSESATGHRNRAISHLLLGNEILDREPEQILDTYFKQCSILVNARDLAMMGACLANNGANPVTGVVALKSRYVEKVLSVMGTCGMYDYSGAWIFDVGMPAKSGVGGGIMAVLPGQFGLGVFSPPLDEKGNSVRGIEACKRLSNDFNLHLFNSARSYSASIVRKVYDGSKFASRKLRRNSERDLLTAEGGKIRVYELQGELLFGNCESVIADLLSVLDEADYLLVDVRRIISVDASANMLLTGLAEQVAREGKYLFFTNFSHLYQFRRYLTKHLKVGDQVPGLFDLEDTDHALEWCENELIGRSGAGQELNQKIGLDSQYLCSGMSAMDIEEIQNKSKEQTFTAGEYVVRAGAPADCMYFILSGEVEVVINSQEGNRLRLTTMGAGTAFGEVALVNRRNRTADVLATMDTVCLQVCLDTLNKDIRNKMLVNMASHFAEKIERDTELMKHLG